MSQQHWSCDSFGARAFRSPASAGISWCEIARRVTRRLPDLEVIEDIWPYRDQISEMSACGRFGGSTDIRTDVVLLAHTHSEWVGRPVNSWADEGSDIEEDSKLDEVRITHKPNRAATLHTQRQKIIARYIERQNIENQSSPVTPLTKSSTVSFNRVVVYVEPCPLHVCHSLNSISRGDAPNMFSSSVQSSFMFGGRGSIQWETSMQAAAVSTVDARHAIFCDTRGGDHDFCLLTACHPCACPSLSSLSIPQADSACVSSALFDTLSSV